MPMESYPMQCKLRSLICTTSHKITGILQELLYTVRGEGWGRLMYWHYVLAQIPERDKETYRNYLHNKSREYICINYMHVHNRMI